MSTAKNSLIALLAMTSVGGATLAWHQYNELLALRAAALTADERADLQKKISSLQKTNRELQDKLTAAESARNERPEEAAGGPPSPAEQTGPERRGPGAWGNRFAAIQQAMSTPEAQALMNAAAKGRIEGQYAALFKNLNLTADQADKLASLLAERQTSLRDVFSAAREQGINPRSDPEAFQKLIADAQAPINDNIKALIGDAGMSQLSNYEQTMPQRNLVNVLQQRLSYTQSPLTSTQSDQLVQILANNSSGGGNRGNWGGPATFGFGGMMNGMGEVAGPGTPKISNTAVSQAGSVLNTEQLSALQQMQQQQADAQKLRDLMRNAARPPQQTAPAPAAGKGPG